eukprot:Unigene11944_Nuclearia_a/m.36348 Unigene11944_Nuclearia_a/g.36348  ORF Unigene11944_Nuclearia_a/g.36348 Unigene11944_Nuclearia_a/m.36348 type:complete len:565 (+) Unigene11944_Nuclearia_a:25-1719(+)
MPAIWPSRRGTLLLVAARFTRACLPCASELPASLSACSSTRQAPAAPWPRRGRGHALSRSSEASISMADSSSSAPVDVPDAGVAYDEGASLASSYKSNITLRTTAGETDVGASSAGNGADESTALLPTTATSLNIPARRKRAGSTTLNKIQAQRALMRWVLAILVVSVVAAIVIVAVTLVLKANPRRNELGCIFDYDPNINYFPDRVSASTAAFAVSYGNNYKWLNNTRLNDAAVVTQCGTSTPDFVDDATKNFTCPVKFVANVDRALLPFFEMLNIRQTVLIQDSPEQVVSPCFRLLIDGGRIEPMEDNIGQRLIQLQAVDVSFDVSTIGSGQKGVALSMHAESEPLAAAEWGKVAMSFFNYEREVTDLFNGIKDRYQCWQQKAVQYVANGNRRPNIAFASYAEVNRVPTWTLQLSPRTSALVTDAGGAAILTDAVFTNVTLLHEALQPIDIFFDVGEEALNWRQFLSTYELSEDDAMPFIANGSVYRFDRLVNNDAFSDWDENGVAQPDAALLELIAVFHPALALSGYTRRWLRNLPAGESPVVELPDICVEAAAPIGQWCT